MPSYIIRFKSNESFQTCCEDLLNKNCPFTSLDLIQSLAIELPFENQSLEQLIPLHQIERVYYDLAISLIPDKVVETNSKKSLPWGMKRIGAIYSKIPHNFSRPLTAVLDTGIQRHPSLKLSSLHLNLTDESISDENGHGTHIAGIISGYVSANSRQKNRFHGVYPELPTVSVKAFNKEGASTVSKIIKGIQWCIQQKIKIINMSFGLNQHHPALYEAIRMASNEGILMIAASGNNREQGIGYPARYEEVIAVGSIDQSDQPSSFSQYGMQLNLLAPGEEISSTWLNRGFSTLSGTSMACAHATGCAAAVCALYPQYTASEKREYLLTHTEKLQLPYQLQGNGLVSLMQITEALKK